MPELLAFGARGRRREAFMALARRYQALRLKLLDDLARQSERLELATGLGGLTIALLGAKLAADGRIDPVLLPLFILISVAAFLPVSEIAQVSRQLADTIASTRRLEVVESAEVRIVDGPLDAPAPRGGMAVRFERVRFAYPGRSTAALSDVSFEVPCRRDRRAGRVVRRGQDHGGEPAAAFLGSRRGRDPAGAVSSCRGSRSTACASASPRRAGHLPLQRHPGIQHPARAAGRIA
jgi:ABC-type multidrug transport system fused ATPase/permease subunit